MTTLEKIKFPTSASADWAEIAARELDHHDPFTKLSQMVNGISVKPYYDAKDVPQIEQKTFRSTGTWLNVPKISVHDTKFANREALHHLNFGADGILFDLNSNIIAEDLLKGIELPHCQVFFLCDVSVGVPFLESFGSFVSQKKWKLANDGIYWRNGIAPTSNLIENFYFGFEMNEKEDSTEKLSSALHIAVSQIDSLIDSGEPLQKAFRSVSFLWPVQTNFFLAIAELRAMRMLWTLMGEAYGDDSPLFLHANSKAWIKDNFQPHGNMIKQTTSGLAAVLGNCNAITCEAEKEDVSMLTRAARNIISILKEESHLDKPLDPVAGSYFLECFSNELAANAWKKFQASI